MPWTLLLLIWACFARAKNNATMDVVNGTPSCPTPNIPGFFYRSNCSLICRESTWVDILIFYLGNYVAHAGTVVTKPGQSPLTSLATIINAMLFPGSGILNGMDAILTFVKSGNTNLQVAARAGALCAVVKVQSEDNESLEGGLLQASKEPAEFLAARVHGQCRLPKGYVLLVVPKDLTFINDDPLPQPDPLPPWHRRLWRWMTLGFRQNEQNLTTLSCSYNIAKIIVSILQLLFAVSTLYRTRGDQVSRYGYAAFGLTVIPYAYMSFLNLIGNAIRPQYDAMYIVRSRGLDKLERRLERASDAEKQQFTVTGEVGRLSPESEDKLSQLLGRVQSHMADESEDEMMVVLNRAALRELRGGLRLLLGAVPIAIVGVLTRFQPGESALYQRVWVMTWIVFGIAFGTWNPIRHLFDIRPVVPAKLLSYRVHWNERLRVLFLSFVYAAPAIGGYIVVGQMIKEFGICFLNRR